MRLKYFIICVFFILFFANTSLALVAIESLLKKQDAVLVKDPLNNIVFEKNIDKKLIPASILKLLTSILAFHYLGKDFRFETEFYQDSALNLKIKGYGDPMLISEVLLKIAQEIVGHYKIKAVNDIWIDTSFFASTFKVPGVISVSKQPYDAPNQAVCVNFNTIFFKKNHKGEFVSAESQTPLIPFILPKIEKMKISHGRIKLDSFNNESVLYAGHMFKYFFENQGMKVNGKVRLSVVDQIKDTLIFPYRSEVQFEQIIERLLRYSNNFIANQIFLRIGAQVFGGPATMDKGIKVASIYCNNILGLSDIEIFEGSGISRKNRISAKDMCKILNGFKPFFHLMRSSGNEFYKTGTLKGVDTKAGYIKTEKGLYSYVIILNSLHKNGRHVISDILNIIKKNIAASTS